MHGLLISSGSTNVGNKHIQGLVAALGILSLRGQLLDLSPVYPGPGTLVRNPFLFSHLLEISHPAS
jgi:hypothetical protein